MKHPDWEYLDVTSGSMSDPLGLRKLHQPAYRNSFYGLYRGHVISDYKKDEGEERAPVSTPGSEIQAGKECEHAFPGNHPDFWFCEANLQGGYWGLLYFKLPVLDDFSTSWMVVKNSAFFGQPQFFLQFPGAKYEKSSLSE